MRLATLRQMFAMDGVVTAANSSIAIAAAVLVATDPRAVLVLLVPVGDRVRRLPRLHLRAPAP